MDIEMFGKLSDAFGPSGFEEDEQNFSYVPEQAAGRITLAADDGDISIEND